ncbi:MAG: DUF1294 domain-containing protein [Sulfitobacter sp.]
MATFVIFGIDKFLAIRNRRRIAERTLLIWTACGGSLGAKLAQQVFRHKTRKHPFARWLNIWLCLHIVMVLLAAYWIIFR